MAERTKWTPEMVDRLRELRNQNWTVLEIAQEMGLPFEVVQGRINRERSGKLEIADIPQPDAPPFSETETTEKDPLLTKEEAAAIADFIEFYIFDAIRKDPEADNIFWLIGVVRALDKLCAYSGYKLGSGSDSEEETNAE